MKCVRCQALLNTVWEGRRWAKIARTSGARTEDQFHRARLTAQVDGPGCLWRRSECRRVYAIPMNGRPRHPWWKPGPSAEQRPCLGPVRSKYMRMYICRWYPSCAHGGQTSSGIKGIGVDLSSWAAVAAQWPASGLPSAMRPFRAPRDAATPGQKRESTTSVSHSSPVSHDPLRVRAHSALTACCSTGSTGHDRGQFSKPTIRMFRSIRIAAPTPIALPRPH
jgi:hypothetical protein